MCNVRPFCGLRYNLQRINDPSTVISPPYDIISPEERLLYHSSSPYNIVRLESSEEQPGDAPENNKYTRAAATLDQWLREGILVRESEPAMYVIEHRFTHGDIERSRLGLIARVRLEEFESGWIRPHERTKREPSVDRLNLLRACRANTSPIMGLAGTENGELLKLLRELVDGEPFINAGGGDNTTCRMWIITGSLAMEEILSFFAGRVIYIADGHHRYKTALRYRQEQRAARSSTTGDEPFNYIMMSLMDSSDPALAMLPIHRLLRAQEPDRTARLEKNISPFFHTDELLPPLATPSETVNGWLHTLEIRKRDGAVIGLYGLHGHNLCLLKLREDADLKSLMSEEELKLWRNSGVVLLQRIILQKALGIDTPELEAGYLEYYLDALEAKTRVDSGEYRLAFLLNPVPVSHVLETASAGLVLPRKSTYFHPKTPAGLVINPVWDEA